MLEAVIDLNRKEEDNAGGHQEQLLRAVIDLNRKEDTSLQNQCSRFGSKVDPYSATLWICIPNRDMDPHR